MRSYKGRAPLGPTPPSQAHSLNPAAAPVPQRRLRETIALERPPLVDRVVVAVQGSDSEYDGQLWGVQLAASLGVPLFAIHVARPGEPVYADLFTYVWGQALGARVEFDCKTLIGVEVVEELLEEISPRDIIVAPTRRLASGHHVGSVAEQLVRRAPCPVVLVRSN